MRRVGKIFLSFYIASLFLFTATVQAEIADHLIISEVQISGASDTDEYIELYNPTNEEIDLIARTFRIERATSSTADPAILIRFDNLSDVTYPAGKSIILPGEHYLIARDDASESLVTQADAIGLHSGFVLTENNFLYLGRGAISGPSDVDIIDSFFYGNNNPAGNPGVGQSVGRKWDLSGSVYLNELEIESPTPKARNIVYSPAEQDPEEPIVYSTKIYINEFLPAPGSTYDWDGNGIADSNDEWIELISLDDRQIDLGGWVLDDVIDGGSASYTIPSGTIIDPDGFLVFYKKDTAIVLNNTGDSVILKNPNGDIVDQYVYSSTFIDKGFSRDKNPPNNSWVTNYAPSPGSVNLPPVNQNPVANAGANISNAKTGMTVNLNGSASYDPDGTIVAYEWDFGDGSAHASGAQVSHIYSVAGNYQITLFVRDNSGATASANISVSVVQNTDPDPYQNQYSSQIKIIEFLPNPSGVEKEDEYVKLFNFGLLEINLRNWTLDDSEGGSKPFLIDYNTVIKPNSPLNFYNSETGLALNNTGGDSVRLFDPDKKLVDEVVYTGNAPEDVPYILKNGVWGWDNSTEDVKENKEMEENSSTEKQASVLATVPNVSKPDISKIVIKENPIITEIGEETKVKTEENKEKREILVYNGQLISSVNGDSKQIAQKDFRQENVLRPAKNIQSKLYQNPSLIILISVLLLFIAGKVLILPNDWGRLIQKFSKKEEESIDKFEELFK